MKELYLGNCLEVLETLPENSVDTVITDPPYHLTSITKRWKAEGREREFTNKKCNL